MIFRSLANHQSNLQIDPLSIFKYKIKITNNNNHMLYEEQMHPQTTHNTTTKQVNKNTSDTNLQNQVNRKDLWR